LTADKQVGNKIFLPLMKIMSMVVYYVLLVNITRQ